MRRGGSGPKIRHVPGSSPGSLDRLIAGRSIKHRTKGLVGEFGTLKFSESSLPPLTGSAELQDVFRESRGIRVEMKVPEANGRGKAGLHGDVIAEENLRVRMLSDVEATARKEGYGFVWTMAEEGNAAAVKSYTSRGWVFLGKTRKRNFHRRAGWADYIVYGKKL